MKKVFCLMLITVALGLLAVGAGCTSETEYNSSGTEELAILSHKMSWTSYGSLKVTGTAKNVGSERLSWASIDCRFYDSAGNQVDKSSDYMSDLDPGQTWAFEVICLDDRAVTYDIGVGSCW